MAGKDIIVKFKKSASGGDKQNILEDIQVKGGKVVNKENIDSAIFPYVVVNVSPDHLQSLQSNLGPGHAVVDNIEEDKEVKTQ